MLRIAASPFNGSFDRAGQGETDQRADHQDTYVLHRQHPKLPDAPQMVGFDVPRAALAVVGKHARFFGGGSNLLLALHYGEARFATFAGCLALLWHFKSTSGLLSRRYAVR